MLRREDDNVVVRGRAGAEKQRKKAQPLVLRRGAGQQWLHVTAWHGEEEFPAQYPQGVMAKTESKYLDIESTSRPKNTTSGLNIQRINSLM